MSETIVSIRNLQAGYQSEAVLENITLNICRGDFIALLGPNGAGKTTLIKAMLGIIPALAGEVRLFGSDLKSFCRWDLVGYLPQNLQHINPLLPATVEEIVATPLKIFQRQLKLNRQNLKNLIDLALKQLRISQLRHKSFNTLSGGQQQRVLVARTIVARPQLLLFDEPTSALDNEIKDNFFALLESLNREQKCTIIFITHETACLGKLANKILLLDKRVIFYGDHDRFHDHESSLFYTKMNICD